MRTLYFQTNYNNKLACGAFLHLDRAPKDGIPESRLNQVFEIRTADNSFPPIKARLFSLTRIILGRMADCFSLPSHGKNAADFIEWWKLQNPDDNESLAMAVYYYKKDDA